MFEARLKSKFRLDAMIRKASSLGFAAYMAKSGFDDSGVIIVKIAKADRKACLYAPQRDFDGNLTWKNPIGELHEKLEESQIDAYIKRTSEYDDDCWVLEIDDMQDRFPAPPDHDFWTL